MNICEADIIPGCLLLRPRDDFAGFDIPPKSIGFVVEKQGTEPMVGIIKRITPAESNELIGKEVIVFYPEIDFTQETFTATIEREVNNGHWQLLTPKHHD